MQTHVPNGWDHPRLALLTDNGMAWRFRAQLATRDYAVIDCRGASPSAVHDELVRLQPYVIAVSLRDPQRYAATVLDYASAKRCADYCLFWAGPQQWLRGLDPQLLEHLGESHLPEYNERSALQDAIALARLLFMTGHPGLISVDLVDIRTCLASGGQNARFAVESIYIPNPPRRRSCHKQLRRLRRKFADVRGAGICFELQHGFRLSDLDVVFGAMHDSVSESTLIVAGAPSHVLRPCGLKMRLLIGFVWLPPDSRAATIDSDLPGFFRPRIG